MDLKITVWFNFQLHNLFENVSGSLIPSGCTGREVITPRTIAMHYSTGIEHIDHWLMNSDSRYRGQ